MARALRLSFTHSHSSPLSLGQRITTMRASVSAGLGALLNSPAHLALFPPPEQVKEPLCFLQWPRDRTLLLCRTTLRWGWPKWWLWESWRGLRLQGEMRGKEIRVGRWEAPKYVWRQDQAYLQSINSYCVTLRLPGQGLIRFDIAIAIKCASVVCVCVVDEIITGRGWLIQRWVQSPSKPPAAASV